MRCVCTCSKNYNKVKVRYRRGAERSKGQVKSLLGQGYACLAPIRISLYPIPCTWYNHFLLPPSSSTTSVFLSSYLMLLFPRFN